jgi:ABC-type phosphate/phosphonate transport system substrate-binding protein
MLNKRLTRRRAALSLGPRAADWLWTLLVLACLPAPTAWGYFQDVALGARPAAMGDAFVAVADDTHAMLFNPAGFARLQDWAFSAMYADLYAGLNARLYDGRNDYSGYHFLGLGAPINPGHEAIGASWTRLYSALYSEDTIAVAYARRVHEPLRLDAGVSVKGLQWAIAENQYTSDTSYFSRRQKAGMTFDVGLLASPWGGWSLGLACENFWPADVGLVGSEIVPMILRGGIAYAWGVHRFNLEELVGACEMESRSGVLTPKVGVETWWLGKSLALRAGSNTDSVSAGLGVRYARAGFPVSLQLDYAFSYPFKILDTLGSHRLEMTVGWAFPQPQVQTALAAAALNSPAATAASLPAPLSTAADEGPGEEETDAKNAPAPVPALPLPPGNKKISIIIGYDSNLLLEYGNLPEALQHVSEMEKWFKARTGVTVERMSFNGASGLLSALRSGEVDMILCSQTVNAGARQQALGESLLVPLTNNKSEERYCLVVRDDNVFTSLAQLNGRRLGYIIWDNLSLLKSQFQLDSRNFNEKRELKNSRDAIVALQVHAVDAVLVSEHLLKVFEAIPQPQPLGIKVLAYSGPLPKSPCLIRRQLSPHKYPSIQKLKSAFLGLKLDREGQRIFKFFDIDGWVSEP